MAQIKVLGATDEAAPTGRKPRIGVLMPAGRVVDHDRVVTHAYQDPERSMTAFTNIGDCFVYESSLRILDYSEVHPIFFSREGGITDRQYEKMNTLDYIFLRGSNYINTNGQWDAVCDVLERIKVPVIAFGIGVQVPDNAEKYVNESTRRFLHLMADRSTTLGVRGELSARALRSIGIRNVRVIGCPTAFRHCRRRLTVRRVESGAIERLGFTLRRKTYGSAMLQRYLLRTLSEQYPTTILCAGELEEKAIYYANRGVVADAEAVAEKATQALIDDGWIYGPQDPLLKLYRDCLAVFESVADFEAAAQSMSAVTGFRLHGNLMALANGVPALYATYDTRTREFAQSLKIPAVGVRTMDRIQFRKVWDEADFDAFEKGYTARLAELEAFLDENGMAHRLEPAGASSSLQAAE